MSKTLRNRAVRAGNGSKNPRPSRLRLMKHAGYEVVLSTVVMAQSTHENFSRDAPAVLREDVAEWFELESDSPYMLVVARCPEGEAARDERGRAAAVRHRQAQRLPVVGNCVLRKAEQDPALKQDYSSAFELD
jgi:hypothetical protein